MIFQSVPQRNVCLLIFYLFFNISLPAQNNDWRAAADTLIAQKRLHEVFLLLNRTERQLAVGSDAAAQLNFFRYAAGFYEEKDDTLAYGYLKKAFALSFGQGPGNWDIWRPDYAGWAGFSRGYGFVEQFITDFDVFLPQIEQALADKPAYLSRIYSGFSLVLRDAGNYERCNLYGDQAIAVASLQKESKPLILCYSNRSLTLFYQGRLRESDSLSLLVTGLIESGMKTRSDSINLGREYIRLATNRNAFNQPEKALDWLQKAEKLYQNLGLAPDDDEYTHLDNIYASAWSLRGDVQKAISYYEKIYRVHPDDIKASKGLAKMLPPAQRYEEAHRYADTALAALHYSTAGKFDDLLNPYAAPSVLDLKAQIYVQEYQKTGNPALLQSAVDWYDRLMAAHQYVIDKYHEEGSRSTLYEESLQHSAAAFSAAWQYAEAGGGEKMWAEAFDFIEVGKSMLLLKDIRSNREMKKCNIPDGLRLRERELRLQIMDAEKTLFETGRPVEGNQSLFALKNEYNLVQTEIRAHCRDFFRQAFLLPRNSVSRAQRRLDKRTTLLAFFRNNDFLYTYVINQEGFVAKKQALDFPLDQWTQQVCAAVSRVGEGADYTSAHQEYAAAAWKLYEKLILPLEAGLRENVVVIADDVLYRLPFELLLSTETARSDRFQTLPYWLRRHNISYSQSVNMWLHTLTAEASAAPGRLLALAPFFEGKASDISVSEKTRADFRPLRFSGEEAVKVAAIMDGQALLGSDARRNKVIPLLNQYRILHFATHAKANEQRGDYSYLAFQKPEKQISDAVLYARDLYNLQTDADLVVLSACESGIGEKLAGDGPNGLVRAFTYNGARSVLSAAWPVGDESTKELMVDFYSYLKKGMHKSEALRRAKLHYLEQHTGSSAHPFYWAGFLLTGN